MNKQIVTNLALASALAASAFAINLTPEEQARFDATEPAQTIHFDGTESLDLKVALSTKARPTERQMVYQSLEYTCFIHFGPNTFNGVEWGNGKEDPASFAPEQVDTDQWCRVAKEAGMTMMMITMKHHDGFCSWQTRYTEHSVKNSPWQNGKGDVLRDLSRSAKKYGLKVGVYLSPADLYQIENENGLYGNLSEYQDSVIPTDPDSFRTNPMKGRTPPAGKPTFTYKVDDYNRYMLNQLYETLTEYGDIHEVWFDGAHPKRKGGQTYTYDHWYEVIRTLAPMANIVIKGPDGRWCGNEHGGTRKTEWTPIPFQGKYEDFTHPDMRAQDLGSRAKYEDAGFVHWWVNEVDTSIRHGWFWRNEEQHVRSAEEVYDIYERAVGGNSVFLFNIPPNTDGRFADRDVKALRISGQRIRNTYGQNAAELTADGNIYTFDKTATINRVMLKEPIQTHGQRVEVHAVDAWVDGAWKEVVAATTIGYKRILRFPDVTTNKIRVRIEESRLDAELSHVSVHLDIPPLKAPTVSRDRDGLVSIETVSGAQIRYTLDGSKPSKASEKYTQSISLPTGGTVNAIAVRGDEISESTTARYDLAKAKWTIHAVSSENAGSGEGADKAIDGNPNTLWHSKWSGGTDPFPHSITIDFGEEIETLKGFSYLPRKGNLAGTLDQYRVELSRDGEQWVKASEGRMDNIKNDPTQRDILFERSYPGVRYLRFTGLRSVTGDDFSSAAEIGVVTR